MDQSVWRRRGRLIAVPVLAAAALTVPTGGASGSCVGPRLTSDGVARAGAPLVVRGEYFRSGCNDTGQGRLGCSGPTEADEEAPLHNVELRLRQGGRSWVLGTEDASDGKPMGAVLWRVRLPSDVRPGPARLVADTAELRVTVG